MLGIRLGLPRQPFSSPRTSRRRASCALLALLLPMLATEHSVGRAESPSRKAMTHPAPLDVRILAERFDQFLDRNLDTDGVVRLFGEVVEKETDPDVWRLKPKPLLLPGVTSVQLDVEEVDGAKNAVSTAILELTQPLETTRAALAAAFHAPLKALPRGPAPGVPPKLAVDRLGTERTFEGGVNFALVRGSRAGADPIRIARVQFDRMLEPFERDAAKQK